MKKITHFIAAAVVAAFAVTPLTLRAEEGAKAGTFGGTIIAADADSITITNTGLDKEATYQIPDNTPVVKSQGGKADADDLKVGVRARVFTNASGAVEKVVILPPFDEKTGS